MLPSMSIWAKTSILMLQNTVEVAGYFCFTVAFITAVPLIVVATLLLGVLKSMQEAVARWSP
jgi:hypothetical protein